MIVVDIPEITDLAFNLAIEEFLLRELLTTEQILFFYVNEPSIVVGRNQNVFEEVNARFVREHHVPVIRRLSGGGTVFHDLGNLNYSLISPRQDWLNNYEAFTYPVVQALSELGLQAELRNRSSLFVNGLKVSGNAQYATSGKLLSHGTMLVDSDLEKLGMGIDPPRAEVESRAIQSVRKAVANINDFLHTPVTLSELKDILIRCFSGTEAVRQYRLSEGNWSIIEAIVEERYQRWSWNVGRSPKFTLTRKLHLDEGDLILRLTVEKGIIREIVSEFDLADGDSDGDVLSFLLGVRFEREALVSAVEDFGGMNQAARDLVVQLGALLI